MSEQIVMQSTVQREEAQMEEVVQKKEEPSSQTPCNSKKASKNAAFKNTLKQKLRSKTSVWSWKLPKLFLLAKPGWRKLIIQRSRVEDDHDPRLLGRSAKKWRREFWWEWSRWLWRSFSNFSPGNKQTNSRLTAWRRCRVKQKASD